MKGRLPAIVLAAIAAGFAAVSASGKEGVEATLETSIPLNASPGERLTVAWTLAYRDDKGKRRPFNASGVYVRLFSAANGRPTIGPAFETAHPDGRYEATVLAPQGGIDGVQIGLQGWANGVPSDVFFPITNNPLPAVTDTTPAGSARAPAPESREGLAPVTEARDGFSALWIAVLVLAPLLALGSLAIVLRNRRRLSAPGARQP